jgi:hypothetical protein
MARSLIQIIGSTFPLIFGILGFAFIITSFVSRDWVRQEYFPPQLQPLDWKDPLFTIYRSPFILCSANPSKTSSNTTTYDIVCNRYKVSGRGQTACQTPNETDAYSTITGDWRMCQQVHLSGNLILASLVFVCVAFLVLLILSYFFIIKGSSAISSAVIQRSNQSEGAADKDNEVGVQNPAPQQVTGQPTAVIIGTYFLLIFLAVTAMCAFLSQFYAIMGLVQSQPDNGMWASMSLGSVQDSQTGDLHHAPWIQGNALTVYISLGWLFSALEAGAIGGTWLGQFRA